MLSGYELIAQIGEGGMGAVYKARQVSLDRIVALKVLRADLNADQRFVERFRREALLAAKIEHPNAVRIYDAGEDRGRHFIVMEYVEGTCLDGLLHEGPMEERRALAIASGVARTLAIAHARGIVHRDIKPANILLTPDGKPKLADLGIAKHLTGGAIPRLESGDTSGPIGTPHYMSPEQCRGDTDIDGRADIYSLGATLFHMVCGRFPFEGDTTLAVMQKQVDEPLPDPKSINTGVSDGTAALIRRMMEKSQKMRPQSCEELIAAIEVCANVQVRGADVPQTEWARRPGTETGGGRDRDLRRYMDAIVGVSRRPGVKVTREDLFRNALVNVGRHELDEGTRMIFGTAMDELILAGEFVAGEGDIVWRRRRYGRHGRDHGGQRLLWPE